MKGKESTPILLNTRIRMNNDDIINLTRHVERLQITLNRARIELEQVKENLEEARAKQEEERNRPIEVGDRVRILNIVKLSNRLKRPGVEGVVVRVTVSYVTVKVEIPRHNRQGVEEYEIRRQHKNVKRV